MDRQAAKVGSVLRLHCAYLAQRDVETARAFARWQATKRIALSALLAGAILQLYLLHVYTTIAVLPTLSVGVLYPLSLNREGKDGSHTE